MVVLRSESDEGRDLSETILMNIAWHVYILQCRDGSYYTGIAQDPYEREKRHNAGKGAAWTRARRPVKLVFAQAHDSQSAARAREIEIKGWRREKKESLINSSINMIDS